MSAQESKRRPGSGSTPDRKVRGRKSTKADSAVPPATPSPSGSVPEDMRTVGKRGKPDLFADDDDDFHIPNRKTFASTPVFDLEDEDEDAATVAVVSGDRLNADDFTASCYRSYPRDGRRGVFASDWILRITHTKAELLVLAQLSYWFGQGSNGLSRAKRLRDGHLWVYKSHRKLGEEVALTKGQVRGAVRKLVARGLLIVEHPAEELPHYRIDPAGIDSAVADATRPPSPRASKTKVLRARGAA